MEINFGVVKIMLIIVTYDVSTETSEGKNRLNKVAKCCIKHGQRVQNSVFECNLDYGTFLKMKAEIKKIIDVKKDSIRFYILGNNYHNKVEHIGVKASIALDDPIII